LAYHIPPICATLPHHGVRVSIFNLPVSDSILQLRFLLALPPDADVTFERFSDSAGSYVALDSENPAIYKQLYRAAKAKLKLRIKATVTLPPNMPEAIPNIMDDEQPCTAPLRLPTPPKTSPASRHSYLETVLSSSREPEEQACRIDSSTTPAPSAIVPEYTANIMSLGSATDDRLAASVNGEQVQGAKKEADSQAKLVKNGGFRRGPDLLGGAFCIDCNKCGRSIPDEHYHCGICDDGDFDLCSYCVDADVTCDGEGHWLIKRRIQNGILVSSVTETIAPKKWQEKAPGNEKANTDTNTIQYASRTCNSCINGKGEQRHSRGPFTDSVTELPVGELVSCTDCADYDLCMMCFSQGDHGHHPAHVFQPVSKDSPHISSHILSLCKAGRGFRHAAICDGCDKVSPTRADARDYNAHIYLSVSLVSATSA
jgi:next to BRCA1 gene 1 protein